ncbi:MAG: HINT domain-containing protein, partial [Proteobacteria bacterium]|nr:HINT domain-containing protein [Pseudomonadota bacterium]
VDPVGNFVMGAVDTVTGGATAWLRDKAGLGDQANPCSAAYRYGGYGAQAAELAFGGAALIKGLGRFAARRMARRLPCKLSFGQGTWIETQKGYKRIEDIVLGDEVRSRDDRTGEEVWARVAQVFVRHDAEVLEVVLLEADGDEQTLIVTPEHPLQSVDGWQAVGQMDIGDLVSARDGWAQVVSVTTLEERQKVYNFEVAGTHSYFVGPGGVWAHNGCAPKGRARNTTSSPALNDSPYSPQAVEARIRPPYKANPQHNPRATQGHFRTPEPPDAADIYQTAQRGGMGTWFAKGEGGWYRYFGDNAGTAHFSGIVDEKLVPINIRRAR